MPKTILSYREVILQDRIDGLQTMNAELLAALKQFAECNLNDENCASWEIANKRIRNIAQAAIAKAESKE